jgi:hypothetical protein
MDAANFYFKYPGFAYPGDTSHYAQIGFGRSRPGRLNSRGIRRGVKRYLDSDDPTLIGLFFSIHYLS